MCTASKVSACNACLHTEVLGRLPAAKGPVCKAMALLWQETKTVPAGKGKEQKTSRPRKHLLVKDDAYRCQRQTQSRRVCRRTERTHGDDVVEEEPCKHAAIDGKNATPIGRAACMHLLTRFAPVACRFVCKLAGYLASTDRARSCAEQFHALI